jgi:predicted metalloprotease with PDZ domain
MPIPVLRSFLVALVLLMAAPAPRAAAPVEYTFSFPSPEHHWLQVEATFPDLGPEPLALRVSRSSPGRYSLHDFAKNVYDVRAVDGRGGALALARDEPNGWVAAGHDGRVTVRYKVFGDRLDGTYLAIDPTHAHINMPAAIMWARGLDDRPAVLRFQQPPGRSWRIWSQLYAGTTPLEATAPNLQYLLDSPVEFGPGALRQFSVGGRRIRVAVHHQADEADVDALAKDVEAIVRGHAEIFGELPAFEPGHYTFIADYLPWANGDAMEHRNSTVITAPRSVRDRRDLLDAISHEFFHAWNVERIRPRSLEPFDFERTNISAELWLGEGFTEYYGSLVLSRTGLAGLEATVDAMAGLITSVMLNPARSVRSVEDMSRMASFTDGGLTVDRTNWSTTYISYYPFGGAIALALDLTLRDRSQGGTTLDDFMRAMWRQHGRPGGSRPGFVDRPFTSADAEARLAEVSGDAAFAREFFNRYIRGREAADYAPLLQKAGLTLRRSRQGRAWWGEVALDAQGNRVQVVSPPALDTPAYLAGLDLGDVIRQIDGAPISSSADVMSVFARRKPGDRLPVSYEDRSGAVRTVSVTLAEDPALELVPVERTGGSLSPEQRGFRDSWLRARN